MWRYTLERNAQAIRLAEAFDRQCEIRVGRRESEDEPENVCPDCKALLEPNQEECPVCSREFEAPPTTWTLFRLWRFARPYRGMLLAGFLLTLASTAATLVAPYLTMPLMDDILIPTRMAPRSMWPRLAVPGGLLLSAVVAWGLGWAKTYILALVSERIGSDLRTATYDHLLQLSLEYFGGKRTGDLMARIGSESDRICVFLSLHLLDFATDVLMIGMTAVILFRSIRRWRSLRWCLCPSSPG